MNIILKNGRLYDKKYNSEELVDVTSEAEKYLINSNIDCSEAVLGDVIELFRNNEILKSIFVERRKKVYENCDFKDSRMERALNSNSVIQEFLDYYEDMTRNDIQREIREKFDNKSFSRVELYNVVDKHSYKIDEDLYGYIDGFEQPYTLSLDSINRHYLSPLTIGNYIYSEEEDKKVFTPVNKKINLMTLLKGVTSTLNEMVLHGKEIEMY